MKYVENLKRYMSELFVLLPTHEELSARFPHAKECLAREPLTETTGLVFVDSGDPRVGSVGVRSYFLQCDDCHAKREYRAK